MNLRANNSINKRKQNINKAKLLQLKLIHVFARAILLMKKSKKVRPTFKTDIIKVGLVFFISNFSIDEIALANLWMSFSCSNLALCVTKSLILGTI